MTSEGVLIKGRRISKNPISKIVSGIMVNIIIITENMSVSY
jgi:hypothetical protein